MAKAYAILNLLLSVMALIIFHGPGSLQAETGAAAYLAGVMDQFHQTYEVYSDSHAAGNHFVARGRMPSSADDSWVPAMQECCPKDPADLHDIGINSIECTFLSTQAKSPYWGGWYFMNGVLTGEDVFPQPNWGEICNAGVDLSGATELEFWAKGAQGGEQVEFFCFGVGWDPDTGKPAPGIPCPESSKKISLWVKLSKQWQRCKITLSGKDLSYVLGGFGWVSSKDKNASDVKFYLDGIRFNKARLAEPRFLVSYQTVSSPLDFDLVLRNVAFTYDNAVALLAFLASGAKDRAKLLADALVYAYQNDRFYRNSDNTRPDSRRLRNAYQGGDLILWPGWNPRGFPNTVRMSGFPLPGTYPNCGTWHEDLFQVSTHTGNVAWAMIALLGFYESQGSRLADGKNYLETAISLGDWVEVNCKSVLGPGGYTGGFEGWEPDAKKLTYKATEHNIDLYVAFKRLYLLTHDQKWLDRAHHAKNFVVNMWDENEKNHFWTGTDPDGITTNKNPEQIPLDIQAWANLAFSGEEGKPFRVALDYSEANHRTGCGYDFNSFDRDGIWYEGTAHMALAYYAIGPKANWQTLLSCLHNAQAPDGGLPAASINGLTTGFSLPDGNPWLYYHRAHVGATAWLVLAEKGFNPFWPPKAIIPLDFLLD